jgi:hypothetical protein
MLESSGFSDASPLVFFQFGSHVRPGLSCDISCPHFQVLLQCHQAVVPF